MNFPLPNRFSIMKQTHFLMSITWLISNHVIQKLYHKETVQSVIIQKIFNIYREEFVLSIHLKGSIYIMFF